MLQYNVFGREKTPTQNEPTRRFLHAVSHSLLDELRPHDAEERRACLIGHGLRQERLPRPRLPVQNDACRQTQHTQVRTWEHACTRKQASRLDCARRTGGRWHNTRDGGRTQKARARTHTHTQQTTMPEEMGRTQNARTQTHAGHTQNPSQPAFAIKIALTLETWAGNKHECSQQGALPRLRNQLGSLPATPRTTRTFDLCPHPSGFTTSRRVGKWSFATRSTLSVPRLLFYSTFPVSEVIQEI